MVNNQNTYKHQQIPLQPPIPMWQRVMSAESELKNAFPKWLSQYSIVVYLLALTVVSVLYSSYSIPWYYMFAGVIAMLVFFLFGRTLTTKMGVDRLRKVRTFEKRIFLIAFIPRIAFMILIYWVFMENYGNAFGFENADATYYNELGVFVAELISKGNYNFFEEIVKWNGGHEDISDMGYGMYVGFLYWLTGVSEAANLQVAGASEPANEISILTLRILKCVLSSITVLLIYRLAKRNFGDKIGRVAAIFIALWPNFWYYSAVHLKETEMLFLAVLFVEQADQMLRSRQFTAWKVIPVLLLAAIIFTFRTPLALVALLSLVFSVVMSSSRVVNWGKRIIVGLLTILLIGVTMGNRIEEQSRSLLEQASGGQQQNNMEWRAQREHGNAFAKYAGKSVFAPLIFTIPFPSMVRPWDGQEVQQLLNGGNFVKNIISFFTIFAVVMLLMSGRWREHLLPFSFMVGYLVVLTMSTYAQSERFHQPAMPFEFMFAAYGLSMALTKKKYRRWFVYWCVLMFVACIAWNWFKIAGRGLA